MALIIFDCDGTLVDSQHVIAHCMAGAFKAEGLPAPDLVAVRRVVGLSLVRAVAMLAPDLPEATCERIAERYKELFRFKRAEGGTIEPLYPNVRETLEALEAAGHLLAVATGKSRRGLDLVLAHHDLARYFVSLQTADTHPSKPHPAMLRQALAETGAVAGDALMVGDTSFDMTMAQNAGIAGIGVAYGYHAPAELIAAGARRVLDDIGELVGLLAEERKDSTV
ncbi:HAD-IA family hydrolase [Marinivivus vitaminiproducens]|uniref:HAD-IA family hydrolase n=1 Tax=Marinivivus vitaminiproducens TaxID=3035935 RepID=UPI002798DB8E|nr:HAD-IA family hydrolase [Geminicoccaceae bacterium SCSIO 64248]